jgi:hypothetical protein
MSKAKAVDDPNLLKPLVLNGPAVERDRAVKDQNNSVKPNEDDWLSRAFEQDDNASAAEVSFFATLRGRMSGQK